MKETENQLVKLLKRNGIDNVRLQSEIMDWAADQCNSVGLKHWQQEGTYSAGKKAGAFECRDLFNSNN